MGSTAVVSLLLHQLLAFLPYLQLLPFPASFALLAPWLEGSSFNASSLGCSTWLELEGCFQTSV